MPADLRILPGGAARAGATQPTPTPATVRAYEVLPHREDFRAPQPLRTTLLALAPALVPGVLWAMGVVSAGFATVTGGALLGLGGILGGYAWFDAWRCRGLADRLLRAHQRSTVPSPLADWRVKQLTTARSRRRLADWAQSMIREAELSLRLVSFPLHRSAVEQSLFLLRRLERRLGDLSRPVSPYGVLVVRDLLADGATRPFSRLEDAAELPDVLSKVLAALDRSGPSRSASSC